MGNIELSPTDVSIIVVGCGSRGQVYASYALKHPDRARVVGIAEPRTYTRQKFLKIYEKTIHKDKVYSDWRDIVTLPDKIADCVIIALPDKLHKDAAIAFTNKGYHMLLEKPMATLLDDCKQITMACRKKPNQVNAVCHVLRYFSPCIKIKQLIDSGIIGEIVNINHTEPVGYEHFAHSFVRGNWHNEEASAFSLLAKCCHDVDLIINWMGKKKCKKVSSFGSLLHFRKENAPKNSTDKCYDCPCETECCYSAKKIYRNSYVNPNRWPISVVLESEIQNVLDEKQNDSISSPSTSLSSISGDIEDFILSRTEPEKLELLEKCLQHDKTKYGRCVYKMDNDVCDNQVVNFQFDDNSTATLTMIAFSKDLCERKTIVYGTKGQLEWDEAKLPNQIELFEFSTKKTTRIDCSDAKPTTSATNRSQTGATSSSSNSEYIKLGGHGGSDYWLIDSFIDAILNNNKSLVLTDVEDSFRSHLIVFAAEYSRVNNKQVDIEQFCLENKISFN